MRVFVFCLGTVISKLLPAQPQPVARFTFNNGATHDDIGGLTARFRDVSFAHDRFGNEKHAVYTFGRNTSYVNLGTSSVLKPAEGSISLWALVDAEVSAGSGMPSNPILITKNSTADDYFEAYSLGYKIENNRIAIATSFDSTSQTNITAMEPINLYEWYHYVMAWNDEFMEFYINGRLEARATKGYRTVYNPADSVMVGVTANKKNDRFSQIIVDDIAFFDRVLTPEEVVQLYEAPDPNRFSNYLRWGFAVLGVALFVYLMYLVVRYRVRQSVKKEKQRMELAMVMLETELRVNRALMNPHFVFNSLNALQNLILSREIPQANDYLVKFSNLMRKLIEYNMSDAITLEMEVDLLNRYLEIEDLRFSENIKHSISVDPSLRPEAIRIPVMMLQPFVENAIWHGLLTKQGDRTITITFRPAGERMIECIVEDNGVGRKAHEGRQTERQSLAINFIEQRLALLNQLHQTSCRLEIADRPGGTGTVVKITLPIL